MMNFKKCCVEWSNVMLQRGWHQRTKSVLQEKVWTLRNSQRRWKGLWRYQRLDGARSQLLWLWDGLEARVEDTNPEARG